MEKYGEIKQREQLFSYLDDVLKVAHKKATCTAGNRDHAKQCWARVLIQGIGAYGNLLRDNDLQRLSLEIEEIKRRLEKRQL